MMAIFFFFTSILLLNILIALMNDAYNEAKDQGQLAWLKQWSEVIAGQYSGDATYVLIHSKERGPCLYSNPMIKLFTARNYRGGDLPYEPEHASESQLFP